jgi:hypothetical protein
MEASQKVMAVFHIFSRQPPGTAGQQNNRGDVDRTAVKKISDKRENKLVSS